jgi:hypothetical protein
MIVDVINETLRSFLDVFIYTGRFWMPFLLAFFAWKAWSHYVNRENISKLEWVLLDIKIPREVFKSPEAMELFFANALYQTGGVGTWYQRWWQGNVPAWFSLEIVSIEGRIYFLIRTQKKFKNIIEAQIYAQYPQAEISEVEDYTLRVPPHTKDGDWSMYGTEFVLSKPDPYPIKTYIDYGLDKASSSLDPEQQIDPITAMLEFMGSIGEGEQVWFQILVRPANWKRYSKPGGGAFEYQNWQDLGKQLVKELKDKSKPTKEGEFPQPLTKGEMDQMSAIERSISKYGFDTGIRGIYLARKDKFNATNITALVGSFRQYNSPSLNSFKLKNPTAYDYPWQDLTGNKTVLLKKEMLNAYRLRSYFYSPYPRTPFVMNTEELATIFHFPGKVSETPTFARIDSKKVEPPSNLPI